MAPSLAQLVRLRRYSENSSMTYAFILGALLGLVAGLLICFWKQINTVVQNKDKISAVSGLFDAINNTKNAF